MVKKTESLHAMQQITNKPRNENRMDAPNSVIPDVIHHRQIRLQLKRQGFTTDSRMFTSERSQYFNDTSSESRCHVLQCISVMQLKSCKIMNVFKFCMRLHKPPIKI
jgi:hypothetical protein